MLIVCPNCATSYMVDPAAIGPAGRTVRCARCKTTWRASTVKPGPEIDEFVDSVIAEAEAESPPPQRHDESPRTTAPGIEPQLNTEPHEQPAPADDFGAEPEHPLTEAGPVVPAADTPPMPHGEIPPPPVVVEDTLAISDAPSLVPPIEHPPLSEPATADASSDDIESFVARRERLRARRSQSRRSSRWTAVILFLLAFNVALIGARSEVVRYLPQTASLFAAIGLPVNLRNLAFEDVKISKETHDGVNILIVEGSIVSKSGKPAEVPRLRFAARNATGQEIYSWTALPSRSVLGPGERIAFRSRLASPPADAADVLVRFFNYHDAVSGVK